jgi:hypothetical protein
LLTAIVEKLLSKLTVQIDGMGLWPNIRRWCLFIHLCVEHRAAPNWLEHAYTDTLCKRLHFG